MVRSEARNIESGGPRVAVRRALLRIRDELETLSSDGSLTPAISSKFDELIKLARDLDRLLASRMSRDDRAHYIR
jgi:hypothetical protein